MVHSDKPSTDMPNPWPVGMCNFQLVASNKQTREKWTGFAY